MELQFWYSSPHAIYNFFSNIQTCRNSSRCALTRWNKPYVSLTDVCQRRKLHNFLKKFHNSYRCNLKLYLSGGQLLLSVLSTEEINQLLYSLWLSTQYKTVASPTFYLVSYILDIKKKKSLIPSIIPCKLSPKAYIATTSLQILSSCSGSNSRKQYPSKAFQAPSWLIKLLTF